MDQFKTNIMKNYRSGLKQTRGDNSDSNIESDNDNDFSSREKRKS